MRNSLIERIWIFPFKPCEYSGSRRYRLKDHLLRVHRLKEDFASEVADQSEYRARISPYYEHFENGLFDSEKEDTED